MKLYDVKLVDATVNPPFVHYLRFRSLEAAIARRDEIRAEIKAGISPWTSAETLTGFNAPYH